MSELIWLRYAILFKIYIMVISVIANNSTRFIFFQDFFTIKSSKWNMLPVVLSPSTKFDDGIYLVKNMVFNKI